MTHVEDITVQEIDDFISENTLAPQDKFMFRILRNNYINGESAAKHIENKELHSAKGILVRTKVITWFVILAFLISTIVMYIPEAIVFLKSLP